jgi:hypothetical protein
MYLTRLPPSSCICNSSHCAPTTYDTVPPFFTPPYQAVLDPETGVMLRPLSYLGAARPLMLPLSASFLICTYRTALPLIPD